MQKISTAEELTVALQSILAYSETPNPSRAKLAQDLRELGERVAANDGVAERGKAEKDLIKAFKIQYPDASSEIPKAVSAAISELGHKFKAIQNKPMNDLKKKIY